MLLATLQIIW